MTVRECPPWGAKFAILFILIFPLPGLLGPVTRHIQLQDYAVVHQRFYLNVSKMNTPGISVMANSEHCSEEFENGEQLWRENLYMLVLMETKNIIR